MICPEMRQQMLDADLDELTGLGGTPLARHIAACEPCRVAGRGIAAGTRRFAAERPIQIRATPTPSKARRGWLTGAIGLAAACLTFLVARAETNWAPEPRLADATLGAAVAPAELPVPDHSFAPTASDPVVDAPIDVVDPLVSVEVPEGRRALVMKTRNPSMTVIWLH